MVLLIGGHLRSGTTMIWRLCNSHPDIGLTNEFTNVTEIGSYWRTHCEKILNKFWQKQGILHNNILYSIGSRERWNRVVNIFRNHLFVARYLFSMLMSGKLVDVEKIEAILLDIVPNSHVMGDKYPSYVFMLDNLVKRRGLSCLIIYRDCRDVTSSTLEMVRGRWRKRKWIKNYDSAE